MYRHLAERASSKGASILTGANAESLIFEGGEIAGCNVKSDTSGRFDVRSKIVIDASGHRASLSKQAQLHGGFTRFGVGAEYDLSAPRCSQEEALLIVGSQYAPAGYAWVFPWGEDRVRVGVGILHSDSRANPKDYLADVMEDIHRFGIDLIGSKVREYHFGLIPSSGLASQFAGDRIMAVGDAAGQATLVAGEGIRLSMQAGLMAGQTAVQAISDGRWDRSALIPYEQAFRSKYARNLRISHIINERISTWKDNQWDEHIRVLKTIPPKTLAKLIQSEFAVSDILSWILLRPALWPRAARYICRFLLNRLGKSR
jgi:digeranylgeranylglycerophospholipid reductase